jgi:hypothetical protein
MHNLLIGTRLVLGDGGASWRTQRFVLVYVLSELIMSVSSYSCVMFKPFFFLRPLYGKVQVHLLAAWKRWSYKDF